MLKVKTPCSSANIGPGFDCMGIAFDIYNEFTFEKSDKNAYEGFAEKYCNDNNLVYKSYKTATEMLGKTPFSLKIGFKGEIPAARGLGSSSTCIVAGVAAAYHFAGVDYTKNDIAKIAGIIEGHPDNVAACVYGGFVDTVFVEDDGQEKLLAEKFHIDESFNFYVLIPDFELSTKQSREVLPKSFPITTAKKNIANIPLLIRAFERGDCELLKFASEDWLHQPYRGGIIPEFFDICKQARELGACAVFLSGAGPTILVVSAKEIGDGLKKVAADKQNVWTLKKVNVDFDGLKIEKQFK